MLSLTVLANAKLNLTLDIVGRRDDGYHLLDSIMQSVSLSDRLHLTLNRSGTVTATTDNRILQTRRNIVAEAARLFLDEIGSPDGVQIDLQKKIPLSSGLGGGSADAAATLTGLNRLYGQPLDGAVLSRLALRLGADVPFCLTGGTARVGGIGEGLSALPPMPDCAILLLKRGRKPSTAEMYRRLDTAENLSGPFTPGAVDALENHDYAALCEQLGNAFAAVWDRAGQEAEQLFPGADRVSLSGSGPTVFALFADRERAEAVYWSLKTRWRYIYLCRPVKKGCVFV